jgi:hypothetical protein
VTFATENSLQSPDNDDLYYESELRKMGILVYARPNALNEALKKPYDAILFEFYNSAVRYLRMVKACQPRVPIIIDTVDAQSFRELQGGEVHQDRHMYQEADLIWAVTQCDKEILLKESLDMKIDVMPDIIEKEIVSSIHNLFDGMRHTRNAD